MKILLSSVSFVFLWLITWPTIEVRNQFDTVLIKNETHEMALEFRPSYVSNNSRLLHKITSGKPYWLGIHISPTKKLYNQVRINGVVITDTANGSQFKISKLRAIMSFSNSDGITIPTIRKPSDYDGYMELEPRDYRVTIEYELCENNECDQFKVNENLSFNQGTKFYSETFSQMMGI